METLQRTANRGSISTGYDIDNSLKMESDNSESMTRTPSSSGNRKTWTVSFWFKRTELGAAVRLFEAWDGSIGTSALFTDTDFFILDLNTASNYFTSTQVFRDTSAWYHFVVRVDTTSATDSERARVYVNGSELVGSWTGGYIGQNTDLTWNQNVVHYLGVFHTTSNFANGYYAEVINVDGTSLAPTEFGEFDADSGIWKPKAYTGSYGTNGFYLDFESSGSLGADGSGNGHTWTLNNITSADQATDTPTNNFCTWNPLWAYPNTATVGNGGTSSIGGAAAVWRGSKGTIGLTNGKWYWEQKANGNDTIAGWQTENVISVTGTNAHNVNDTIALYEAGNYIWLRDETSGRNDTAASGSYANGQIVGFALDLDSSPQTATFYRNGSAIASNVNIDGLTGKTIFPFTSHYQQTSNANFGGYTNISDAHTNTDENGYGAFVYTPPSGYYAICTKNLAEYG